MGFFSWLTADSEESISNSYSSRGARPVYLLQPNYQPAIHEPAYEGYGDFGGVDAMVWLAENNLPAEVLAGLDHDEKRGAGVMFDCGGYYLDTETGEKISVFHDCSMIDPEIRHLGVTYDVPLDEFGGLSANDLVASGRFAKRGFEVKRPLKFSFREDADYNALPASRSCPDQGYFYADGDDGDDDDDRYGPDESEDLELDQAA